MGKRFASFHRCVAFARFWKVKFWRSFIKRQYFSDSWDGFSQKNIYLYLGLFSKTGKTWVSHWVKMMTRWPRRERWPKWPGDPVPCLFHRWWSCFFHPCEIWSHIFQSCVFHPRDLVPHFPVLHFPPLRFGSMFSIRAFSASPNKQLHTKVATHMNLFFTKQH